MTTLWIAGIALATAVATMLGGWLALALRGRLNLVLGFSAGAVIGVAFFDLLPEAIALKGPPVLLASAVGFLLYLLFDRLVAHRDTQKPILNRGWIGAASLCAHSVLDGFGIGIAFQAGAGTGIVVAAAVLAHDFADGLNTVNIVTRNGGDRSLALRWLVLDALAPLAGAGLSLFFTLSAGDLALMLAGFAGFFLYIGAVDLLPESQRASGQPWSTIAVIAGALFLLAVAKLSMQL